jgi:hypothetical protein
MDWPERWWAIDAATAAGLEEELRRELSPGHPLFNLPLHAIGQTGSSDDVLFTVIDGSGRVAVAHLTWRQGAEPPPWPSSIIYESFAVWAKKEQEEWDRIQAERGES